MSALQKILSEKTDSQLRYYIDHVEKHTEEAVLLALAELKARNVELPDDIDALIKEKLKMIDGMGNRRQWDHFNKDVEIIELYSRPVINIFSVLFSVFFASLLLSDNYRKLGKPTYGPALFGLGFLLTLIVVNLYIFIGIGLSFLINIVGGMLLSVFFPDKTSAKQVIIRDKPVEAILFWGFLFNFVLGLILTGIFFF